MIFVNELTAIDQELEAYERLLSAKRAQRAIYAELQGKCNGYLIGLGELVKQVQGVGEGASHALKTEIDKLFGTDGTGDDGGNQPTDPTPDTDPTPGADDEEPELMSFNGETGDYLLSNGSTSVEDGEKPLTYIQAIKNRCSACWGYEVTSKADIKAGFVNRTNLNFMEAVNLERSGREFYETVEAYLDKLYYNGQTCQLEDCPESRLVGQSCDLATPFTCLINPQPCPLPSSTEMIHTSARTGYLKLKTNGQILATYAWFPRKDLAQAWFDWLDGMNLGNPELRLSQRNSSWKYEVKLTGLNMNQIERLSREDLSRRPSKNKETPAQAAGIEPPSDWGKVKTQELTIPILGEGDTCEVLSGRYKGQLGTVETISNYSECPIALNLLGGHVKHFTRNELKFISKGDAPTLQQGPLAGQTLLGGRIVTTGAYFGQGRRNAVNMARMGTADKVAALELVKAGVSPTEAMAAVTGDYDF
jgi:hypothetical protein